MLEKLKGYIRENRGFLKYLLWLLSVCCLFIVIGFLDRFDHFGETGCASSAVGIFFLIIIILFIGMLWLFYYINLLIVLDYKKIRREERTLYRFLRRGIGISVLEIVQLLLFVKMRDNRFVLTTFVNLLIMLLPYILMLWIQLKSIKKIKEELNDILLSLLITIILYMLVDIENIVLAVSMYSMVYIYVDKRLKKLKEKKVLIIGYILTVISIAYIDRNEIRMYSISDEETDEYQVRIKDVDNRTGECYMRIYGKKKICGKIIKGEEEGKWIYLYTNGKKCAEGIYKDGSREGEWIYYYNNGEKKSEGIYVDNKKEDKWIYWNEDGEKETEIVYENDEEIDKKDLNNLSENILKEGKYIEYFGNREKKSEGSYKKDKKEGKWIYWYGNGKKKAEGMYKEGKREGNWIEWYESGNKMEEGIYKDRRKEGKWIEYWDEDGKKYREGIYKDGKEEGKWIEWHDNGEKQSEENYVKGKREGKWIEWHENGNKKEEGMYREDHKEGKWIYWDESGKKYAEGVYKEGKEEGKWMEYYVRESGKKYYAEVTYKEGKEIERIEYDKNGNRIEE